MDKNLSANAGDISLIPGPEDSMCGKATKLIGHNYRAHTLQLLKPLCLEPVLCNKRRHHNEKLAHCSEGQPPALGN